MVQTETARRAEVDDEDDDDDDYYCPGRRIVQVKQQDRAAERARLETPF